MVVRKQEMYTIYIQPSCFVVVPMVNALPEQPILRENKATIFPYVYFWKQLFLHISLRTLQYKFLRRELVLINDLPSVAHPGVLYWYSIMF